MRRTLPFGFLLVAIRLIPACAPAGSFQADADQCHASVGSGSGGEDYRLPEAVDQATEQRVNPAPQDSSAYVLCMRSRGWKLDPAGIAVGKGLSAGEYSTRVSQDLMVCVRGAEDQALSKSSAEETGSSAAHVVCACLQEKATPGITSVDLNLVIEGSGEIRRVGAEPDSPVATCLREGLLGTSVAQPPSAPWKVVVRILHYQ